MLPEVLQKCSYMLSDRLRPLTGDGSTQETAAW